ncbi:MAG: ribonuclease III [Clostridiales bacterium]|nr:ribonuclease III [Clostridiales bacterium]
MARAANYEKLYRLTGYRFRNEKLLKNALTHSSYASEQKLSYEHNNERLEFIGDAFVDAAVGEELFRIMGTAHEGVLSRCRADVVCEDSLAEAAASMGLGEFLYLGRGEEASGGRGKTSILADAFEALIGAIILDGGYEAGKSVILKILGNRIRLGAEGKLNKDFKTRLQEKLQEKDHGVRIEYRKTAESGPDHSKTFTIELLVNGKTAGTGTGPSKAKAEQAAAEDALSKGV